MERMTRAANFKNLEKNPLLPPQTSLPSNETPVYEDCGPSGSKEEPWLRKALIHDHPSSPESISIEEHLSWLIDLLYEPDTPVKICAHRPRLYSNLHNFALEECRQRAITPSPLLWKIISCGLGTQLVPTVYQLCTQSMWRSVIGLWTVRIPYVIISPPLWKIHEFDPFKDDQHYSPNEN